VIVTSSSGIDRRTVPLLEELSERYAVGVLENKPRFMNFSSEHPNHLGYQINPILEAADVLICLDIDVPWFQGLASPREDATVVQCGTDPLFSRYPVRSHRSDISVMATPRSILAALLDALEGRSEGIDPSRSERIAAMGASRRARSSAAVEAESKAAGPITKPFMNWALAQVRTPETIHVNEYWALPEVLRPTLPGTYFDTPPSGGLGWGLPCALGVQIASPGKTVIASLGDGAYLFANPASCHHAMAMHDLPVLTVLANNAKWGAVEGAARGMYPEGYASAAGELTPIARLDPAAHYEQYSIASGGHGEVVTERSALVPALRRALNVVQREHRQALLNVICQ
jgi:acetolactate synthase-1/2/3 large subunit